MSFKELKLIINQACLKCKLKKTTQKYSHATFILAKQTGLFSAPPTQQIRFMSGGI